MDPKEKNQQTIAKQQEKLEKREQAEQLETSIEGATPEELRGMLSNRNEDYVFRLEKLLQENGLSVGDAKLKTNDLLVQIVVEQRKGHPASQLFGTPQEKVQAMINPEQKIDDVDFWKRAVDNSLLYLAIFAGMFGVVGTFSKAQQPTGIVTILSVGVIFGILMAYYNDLILRKKEDRPAMWKLFLGGFGILAVILAWITIIELPFFRIVNPIVPAWIVLILGVVSYLGRRFYRAKYHIVNSPFTSAQQRDSRR